MIRIEFSAAEIEKLHYERYHHPHPKVQQRMEVLYLKSQGLQHQEICRLCDISKVTLSRYLKQYQEGGVERLKQLNYHGQPSALNAHQETIEAYFREHPPHTISQAQAEIQRLTGIQRQPTQVRAFLQRLGMRCRKVKALSGAENFLSLKLRRQSPERIQSWSLVALVFSEKQRQVEDSFEVRWRMEELEDVDNTTV